VFAAFLSLAGCLLSACARVEVAPDYQRAGALVQERLGVDSVYDPEQQAAIDARVEQLIADGLTIDEAVQLALLANRELQVTFAEIGVSRADLVQSALWSNPTLALGFSLPEGGGVTNFTLDFAQQIADLWQIPVRKRAAERHLERTIALAAHQAVTLHALVRTRCYDVLALRRAEALAAENVQLAEMVLKAARQQVDAGQVSEFDVSRTRANLLSVRADRVAIRSELAQAEAALAELLGLARRREVCRLVGELPEVTLPPQSEGELVALALGQRLDARAAELAVYAAEDELALQYRRVYPDVQLGFSLERNERRGQPGRKVLSDAAHASIAAGQLTVPTIQSPGQRRLADSQVIDAILGPSLAVTLPLWDQNQAQIAKASYRALQARAQYARVLDAIAVQVSQAAIQAEATAELIRIHRDEGLPVAEATVEGAKRLYEHGAQSVLLVVDAQEQLVQRRRDLVRALRDHAAAIAELENALGGRLPASQSP